MGFNKRYIRKEMILDNIDNLSYISGLVKADALIMDTWSRNFFDNFNFKWKSYNELRENLNEDVKFYSFHKPTLEHENYPKLKNLSNVLVNLKTDPSWTDILLAGELLDKMITDNIEIPPGISGRFDPLVKWHIELIEKQYGQE